MVSERDWKGDEDEEGLKKGDGVGAMTTRVRRRSGCRFLARCPDAISRSPRGGDDNDSPPEHIHGQNSHIYV